MAGPQQAIGHYRIIAKIGAGGMGDVWRATDTRLNREVAIKVLPAAFASDAKRMARFRREAEVLASLNHPGIATIYGVEENALVMQLIEGRTLAERMARGPIGAREAVNLAVQIAAGLEHAHRKGVIHRDLKPANIMITPEGAVRILDFGLARAAVPDAGEASPDALTLSLPGEILGTPAYMSPEQTRGESVDFRADIWALGVILYEMLTGRALFAAGTYSETVAAVLHREPDLTLLPPALAAVVDRCLRKNRDERWGWVGDVGVLLEAGGLVAPQAPTVSNRFWKLTAAGLGLAAIAGVWLALRPHPPAAGPSPQVSLNLGTDVADGAVAITPDGSSLVYPVKISESENQLAIRRLDEPEAHLISGSQGVTPGPLFFSRDGTQVGYLKVAASQIVTLPLAGGTPAAICSATYLYGASWDRDGNLVLAGSFPHGALRLAPSGGGAPQPWLKLAGQDVEQVQPQVLPGGRAVLFIASPDPNDFGLARVEVARLPGLEIKAVLSSARWARYLPDPAAADRGYLLYLRGTALYAAPFNLKALAVEGAAVPLLENIRADPKSPAEDALQLSSNGTLVYETGTAPQAQWSVEWLDASGAGSPLISTPGTYRRLQFSPDGSRLVFENGPERAPDLWVYDLRRGTAMRITSSGGMAPAWAPDGQHLAYEGIGGQSGIFWARSDGATPPVRLLAGAAAPWSLSPDGGSLAYTPQVSGGAASSWLLPLTPPGADSPATGAPRPLLTGEDAGIDPMISPDGRWVAYYAPRERAMEVRPLTGHNARWQISNSSGRFPTWSRRGQQLYYESLDDHLKVAHLMVVNYTVSGDTFQPGKPVLWGTHVFAGEGGVDYAPDPDSDRLAVFGPPQTPHLPVTVSVIFNLADKIKRALATQR